MRKDFPRSGGRCRAATKGGIWQARQGLTERACGANECCPSSGAAQAMTEGVHPLNFPLPCNDSPCSTVCSMGKSVEILSGGRGEEQRQTAGFGAAKLCVSQILTELSQKIRRPAIESTRLACIIGMLGTHCPTKVEKLLCRAVLQRNGRKRWKNSVSKNHLRCWLRSSWC